MNRTLYHQFNEITDDTVETLSMSNNEQNQYFEQFKKYNDTSEEKIKNPSKIKKLIIPIAAAAGLLIGTPIVVSNEQIQASAKQWIDDIQYSFKDIMSPKAEKYATHVNETIALKNMDVRLVDVFAQGKYLSYNELVDKKGQQTDNMTGSSIISLKINGKEMFEGYSGSSEILKNHVTSNIGIVHLRNEVPKEKFHVEMKLGPLEGNGEVYAYEFDVNPETFNQKIKTIHINKTIKFNDNENRIKIEHLTMNPLSAMIEHVSTSDHHFDMMLFDEKGKKYFFNTISTQSINGKSESVQFFNQDIESTGNIDDLNKAKSLYVKVLDYGKNHNGVVKIESETQKIKLNKQK